MDANVKGKIVEIKKLLQQKLYRQALDILQILVYKHPKVYEMHLMAGLAQDKLNMTVEAEKSYLQVLDLRPEDANAVKALAQLYEKKGDNRGAIKYLQLMMQRASDPRKQKEALSKLIVIYRKDLNLQKIDPIFTTYCQNQPIISQDFVLVASAHFEVSVENECFNLQKFELMGKKGQKVREIEHSARQRLNNLLSAVCEYLSRAASKYQLTNKQIANTTFQLKQSYPQCSVGLLLLFENEFIVSHLAFSKYIFIEVHLLLSAYFHKQENKYTNLQVLQPQVFALQMLFSYQYLLFFQEFFTLEQSFAQFLQPISSIKDQLLEAVRPDCRCKVQKFILRECRGMTRGGNVENKLQDMKERIRKVQDSYLEEIVAKIAMNSLNSYQKLNEMKNVLKIKINNLTEGQDATHIYRYYYDYQLKIARLFKIMDEQIPLATILQNILKGEPVPKYIIQQIWLQFSSLWVQKINGRKQVQAIQQQGKQQKQTVIKLQQNKQQKQTVIKQQQILMEQQIQRTGQQYKQKLAILSTSLQYLESIINHLQPSVCGQTLRKIAIIKIMQFASKESQVEVALRTAFNLEHSFPTLLSLASYLYVKKEYKNALSLLNQAINHSHYHSNLLKALCFYKLQLKKQLLQHVTKMREGFATVFWVNYLLGIAKCNQRNYVEAQTLMVNALEGFGNTSHQKCLNVGVFAVPIMIKQNQTLILYDEIVLSPQYVYLQFPLMSSYYFQSPNRLPILLKLGQICKIIGRTKSALNYLHQAYILSKTLLMQWVDRVVLLKEYATVMFYMRMFNQAEQTLQEAMDVHMHKEHPFYSVLVGQLAGLALQIGVQKLAMVMKFQSKQLITAYIKKHLQELSHFKDMSSSFLKSKYQFLIMAYIHSKQHTDELLSRDMLLEEASASIRQLLQNYGITDMSHECLAKSLAGMKSEEREIVRECLEDYMVAKYISRQLQEKQTMVMMQLFHRSTIFCVLFGQVTADISLKSAAFLKCIQLDKESQISVDLLASLYLKCGDYLSAAKLFLKSLQINTLNPQCYIGLSICLFCLVLQCKRNCVRQPQLDITEVVQRAFVRINSYLEYLRVTNPNEDYHMLTFLKIILSPSNISSFDQKITLQSANAASQIYHRTLLKQLLQECKVHCPTMQVWNQSGWESIFHSYFTSITLPNDSSIVQQIIKQTTTNLKQLKQANKYHLYGKQMHSVCIAAILANKYPFSKANFYSLIAVCKQFPASNNSGLEVKIKNYISLLALKGYGECKLQQNTILMTLIQIRSVFPKELATKYLLFAPEKWVRMALLLNPSSTQIRTIHDRLLLTRGATLPKKSKLSYRQELVNKCNENRLEQQQMVRQIMLLDRNSAAIVTHIAMLWHNSIHRGREKVNKLVKLLQYVERKHTQKRSLSAECSLKIQYLKLQMGSYLHYKYGEQNDGKNIKTIACLYRGIENITSLKQIKLEKQNQIHVWAFIGFIASLIYNSKYSAELYQFVEKIKKEIKISKGKTILLLLQFIYLLKIKATTQEQLVEQIVKIEEIAQRVNEQNLVQRNTIILINCFKQMLSGNFKGVSAQLSLAYENGFITYSDQMTINYFEVQVAFNTAQNQLNDQEAVETMMVYAQSMAQFAQDPYFKGFYKYLKATIRNMIQPDKISVQLKKAMFYSPQAVKTLFVK